MSIHRLATIAVILSLCSLALDSAAQARDIFVSNEFGSDRSDGSTAELGASASGPVKTVARALRLAGRGDHIVLRASDKPYHECLTLSGGRHSGSPARPFVIHGNGAVLDGAVPIADERWQHGADNVYRYHPRRQTYIRLFRDNLPLSEVKAAEGAVQRPVLEPLQWCLFMRDVYFRTEKDKSPNDYRLTQTGHTAGITLYQVRHVVIRDLFVQGYHLDGINAHDIAEDVRIEQVTSRGNGRSGISVGGASDVTLRQCLVGNNGHAQVRAEAPGRLHVQQCEVIGNSAPAFVNQGARLVVVAGQGANQDEAAP